MSHKDFCLKEAQFHLNKAHEILNMNDTEMVEYQKETNGYYKMLVKLFPMMVLLQSYESPDPDTRSLSDTQSTDESDEDSYAPGTPPRR
jgi:hypothetical protein